MMRMLDVGGLSLLSDNLRAPNDDNLRGYYEFERVKKLPAGDTAWLDGARGKAVKVISALLRYLPSDYTYRVLFMRRKMAEILASQRRMLERCVQDDTPQSDPAMAAHFQDHLARVRVWLGQQSYLTFMEVDYNAMFVNAPAQLARVRKFLQRDLHLERMQAVIEPALYRHRG